MALAKQTLGLLGALGLLGMATVPLHAQYRGGSDPGRATFNTQTDPARQLGPQPRGGNFWTATDARRLPGNPPARVIPSQPAADTNRLLPPAAHLQRFPPPPSLPTFPPTFTVAFPSLRDGYYGNQVIRDQGGQPAYRTMANRREERLSHQK